MADEAKKELPHIGAGGVTELPKEVPADTPATPQTDAATPASPPPPAQTQPEQTPPAPSPEPEKSGGSKIFKIIVIILVVLIFGVLGAAAMWKYSESQSDNTSSSTESSDEDTDTQESDETPDSEETESESEEEEESTVAMSTYSGEYVTGEYPDGWTIVEYYDGEGSDMLVDGGVYTGLTGLKVVSPNTTVFTLQSVWGIGGMAGCSNYYEFPDSEPAYYTDIVDISAQSGIVPTVTTFTASDYVEYELFGKTVRRVGHNMYWDQDNTDNYFNAECGISEHIFIFDSPTYTADGNARGDYQFTIEQTATDEELKKLDDILESLVVL